MLETSSVTKTSSAVSPWNISRSLNQRPQFCKKAKAETFAKRLFMSPAAFYKQNNHKKWQVLICLYSQAYIWKFISVSLWLRSPPPPHADGLLVEFVWVSLSINSVSRKQTLQPMSHDAENNDISFLRSMHNANIMSCQTIFDGSHLRT